MKNEDTTWGCMIMLGMVGFVVVIAFSCILSQVF